jgi:hypothetical protein
VIGRRQFLSLVGGGLAGATISTRTHGGPPPPPLRLVLIMQNNGTQQSHFWPRVGFNSPILEPLLSIPDVARRTTVVRGVRIPVDASGTNGNEHDMGFARMFTGHKLMSIAGEPWGAAPSVDQIVARAWDVNSLALAVHASEVEPYPKPGFNHRRSFCYVAPGMHKIPTTNPLDAYARFFATSSMPPDALAAQLARRKSVLDANAADLRAMQARLGTVEKDKLDAHATAIRQLESQIALSLQSGQCRAPAMPLDYRKRPELLVSTDEAIPVLVDTMVDLLSATIGCGIARIGTLQLGFGGGKWKFAWAGNSGDHMHERAHHDTSDEGTTPENTAALVAANRYYANVVARLVTRLAETPESDGSRALDHTLVVWANEFGRGDHSMENVPIVLIGGPLAGSTGRGKLVDVGEQPFQRLGCTILRSMGLAAEGFGDLPSCGALLGI